MIIPYWKNGDVDGACERIVAEAIAAWRREDVIIDDTTAIVIFLEAEKKE